MAGRTEREKRKHAAGDEELIWLTDMGEAPAPAGFFRLHGRLILLLSCLFALFIGVFLIGNAMSSYRSARSEYDRVRGAVVKSAVLEDDPAVRETPVLRPAGAQLHIDFEALADINDEVVAWLHVPAFDLSYPVVHTDNDEYYLNHTLEKTVNANGAIFVEYRNSGDFSDCNTFLYGHNSYDGSMFGRLHEFSSEEDLLSEHPFFYIYLPDGSARKYRIYSCYVARRDSESFVTFSEEWYDEYVRLTTDLTEVGARLPEAAGGRIVTLSTCYGAAGTEYRYLVHGMQTDE